MFFNLFKKPAVPKDAKTIKFKTDGMHCSSCAVNIDLTLEELPGVFNAKTNYAQSSTKVEYDEKVIKAATLKKSVEDLGYKVVSSE